MSADVKLNREPGVVYDHPTGKFKPGKHHGSGILMLRIRKRRRGEKHKRAGGKLYTKEVAPGWIVDFDGDDKPIEIEVLSPRKHFPEAILKILPPEFLPVGTPRRG